MINLTGLEVEHILFETCEPLSFRVLSWNVPILHVRVDFEELLGEDLH